MVLSRSSLCIFARKPELYRVKTRLAEEIGPEEALEVHRDSLRAVSAQAARLAPQGGLRGLLVFGEPEGAVNDLAAYFPRWSAFMDQGEGELGERLERAFRRWSPAVLMGTDAPNLPDAIVEQAFRDLETHDVVLGPAENGAFTLVGMRKPQPEIFREIPWSSQDALKVMLERAASLKVSLLPKWYDIVTAVDLARWKDRPRGPRT